MKKAVLTVMALVFTAALFAQTLQDAQREIDNENYFKARTILFKLLNDPNTSKSEAAYYLGNTLLKSDDADSAKLFYKMAITPDNSTPISYLATGRLNLLNKDLVGAKAAFTRALQITKMKNANIYYEVGDAYFRPNVTDLQAAITYFEAAYNLDPNNTTIMLALGDAYLENSTTDPTMGGKAMNKYEAAADKNKSLALAWIKIGRLASRGQIWDQAIDAFKKALAIDPNYPLVHKELGTAYYRTKKYDQMIDEYKKYVELSPGDTKARITILEMYFGGGDYQKTADEAKKGLAKEPNNADFQRFVIYSDFMLKQYKDGYDVAKNFLSNPNAKPKTRDYIYIARLATQVGDTTLALSIFPQVLAADSNNCDLLGEYGKALFGARHYDEATKQYELKKQKCGNLTSLDLYYLGVSYDYAGDSLMADTTFAEFIMRNPTSPDGYFKRARVNLKIGKLEDFNSLPYYQKYIEIAASDPVKYKSNLTEAYIYLGAYSMEKQKDKAAAKEYFGKALELSPDDQTAQEYMKAVK